MKSRKRKQKKPLVTVYIVCHNYGRFLSQAVESVLDQSFKDWELLIYNNGSTDGTLEVLERYQSHPKIQIFSQQNIGLTKTCNRAIESALGRYIIRLDADDYLDENALLIFTQTLRTEDSLSLVYSDYFVINENNVVLEHVRHNKISENSKVLDVPAHGACSMIRLSTLLEISKYDEKNYHQDGYDLWLKLNGRYKVKNVNLPLFYYRAHGENITAQEHKILDARQKIKEQYIKGIAKPDKMPEVLAIIPTRGARANPYANPLRMIAGRRLIDYTAEAALGSDLLSRRVVVSEDSETLDYVSNQWDMEAVRRPKELGGLTSKIEETVLWTLKELSKKSGYRPDLVALLYIHVPLRKPAHIDEAIYSQVIFKTDSVISVTRNTKFLYRHGDHGMVPLYHKRLLKQEKDILYEENGAVELSDVSVISETSFLGKTIGHVLMNPRDSIQITNEFDFWMAEQILAERRPNEVLNANA